MTEAELDARVDEMQATRAKMLARLDYENEQRKPKHLPKHEE